MKRSALATLLLCSVANSHALSTAELISSSMSQPCMEYKVVGICYWLLCTPYGCSTQTSTKVKHYVPDAVVSSYATTGNNPWKEVAVMGTPIVGAKGGGHGTNNQANENAVAKFNNVDVIGHPGGMFFGMGGYTCQGAGTAYMPYFLSTLDTLAWRQNIPEGYYPESLIPGLREIGARTTANLWGNVYPRSGFTHQPNDYKAAAVNAQRAADIVTNMGQPHVYQPLIAMTRPGYWPAGTVKESNILTHKWQELTPKMTQACTVFPSTDFLSNQSSDGGYAWALWRPYSCCQQRGQTFLGSVDFVH